MEKSSLASFGTVITIIISVLTYYHTQKNATTEEREKAAENRPILLVEDGRAVSREIDSFSLLHTGPSETDGFLLTIVNHGIHPAANVEIVYGSGTIRPLGDMAASQSRAEQLMLSYDAAKYRYRRVKLTGSVRYVDLVDPSRKFEERFCFQSQHAIGTENFIRAVNRLPLQKFDPPVLMDRCQIEEKTKAATSK